MLASSVQKARKHYCPVVGCDIDASFSPRVNLVRHVTAKHPGIIIDDLLDTTTRSKCIENPTAFQTQKAAYIPKIEYKFSEATFLCALHNCSETICDRETFQQHVRCVHPASDHARVLESALHNNPLILSPMPSPRKFEADLHRAVKHNARPDAFGYREPELWSSIQRHAKNRIANARMIHGRYGLLTPKPCTHCQKRRLACLVYHPEVRGMDRVVTGYCGECKNHSGLNCDVERFAFPEYKLLMDDYIPSVVQQSKGGSVTAGENDSIAVERPIARLRSVGVGGSDDSDESTANDHETSNLHIVDFGSEPSSDSDG
jgi:hypothetical protein